MDILDTEIKREAGTFTVTELSYALKTAIESQFSSVTLRGEISGFKRHTSGHGYFSLKDESSVIDAICWKNTLSALSLSLEDGLEVICKGRVTTYGARSKYQIVVQSVTLAGTGSLLKLLHDRKEKLQKEGLFDAEKKKALPFFPKKIGVITSETGAVIRDILHRLSDRCPSHVLLWPVAVQGDTSAKEVAHAIKGFNEMDDRTRPDVLIIARGGGSLEDLWSFNEENVVRAAANSLIPLISAVGHETDTTLIDFAADRRAPTPTAAAEMVVPVRTQLNENLIQTWDRLQNGLTNFLTHQKRTVEVTAKGLLSPKQVLEKQQEQLKNFESNIIFFTKRIVSEKAYALSHINQRFTHIYPEKIRKLSDKLSHYESLLESFSHEKTLKRGFTLTKTPSGTIVKSSKSTDKELIIVFHDGEKHVKTS